MSEGKKINNVLISVYDKSGLDEVLLNLNKNRSNIFSTGGTFKFIKEKKIDVTKVEDLTKYPSILSGRVKTLHPKIFGGILSRSNNSEDKAEQKRFGIPSFDLIIVDLYPFEDTIKQTDDECKIIEKIDIGGISLIRAAAKNYNDVLVISNKNQYDDLNEILKNVNERNLIEIRKKFATHAFKISYRYDLLIYKYFSNDDFIFEQNFEKTQPLRYGENPHQKGKFFGNLDESFKKLNGKDLSYNNLLDIDSAVNLISEFEETTFAILKHNNACGLASKDTVLKSWKDAFDSDPVSAFGGVLISNSTIDIETASEINKIFFEVLIAPKFDKDALNILKTKKNRIILKQNKNILSTHVHRSVLGGILSQEKNNITDTFIKEKVVTDRKPTKIEIDDMIFASKVCKHSKSNAIVIAKNKRLLSSGIGQTSRIDALNQAIQKAKFFNININDSVMASDAFFPFSDCVEIAKSSGINSVIQPGGSIKDHLSINFCNKNNISMVMSGTRHFKH